MSKNILRKKRIQRARAKIFGTSDRPRLCVFRSLKYIYAQVIDDEKGKILVSVDSRKEKKLKNNIEAAAYIGAEIARMAIAKKIKEIVFDKRGYKYHGRVKALADAARKAGLIF